MPKVFGNSLGFAIAILINALLIDITLASENETLEEKNQNYDYAIAQVTSVSQLSDVQPTDRAFQALQSLVERYGCIAGYPDGTFRGNRALTRYEFAAGLNACLDRVNELIATATAQGVTREDLATLQRLQAEFATELVTLRGRVDTLEAATSELEVNQFSTSTKLVGELITYLGDAFGENGEDVNNTTFGHRTRLDFHTSFTGEDHLRTRVQATNLRLFDTGAEFGGSQGSRLWASSSSWRTCTYRVRRNWRNSFDS